MAIKEVQVTKTTWQTDDGCQHYSYAAAAKHDAIRAFSYYTSGYDSVFCEDEFWNDREKLRDLLIAACEACAEAKE